jgi:ABC-2 type transport system permease protein/ribosome-dependent ATPase
VGVVREKEGGSIVNVYASTITPLEYLLGKVTPYIAVSSINAVLMWVMAVHVFGAPFKGSGPLFLAACVIFAACTTGIGLIVSSLTRSQVAAVLITFVVTTVPSVQFSGIFTPVSFLEGGAKIIAYSLPAMHFVDIIAGLFMKGVGLDILWTNYAVLLGYAVVLLAIGVAAFSKRPRS